MNVIRIVGTCVALLMPLAPHAAPGDPGEPVAKSDIGLSAEDVIRGTNGFRSLRALHQTNAQDRPNQSYWP